MTPQAYRATLKRLALTHEEAARLLSIHPVTSRKGTANETATRLLTLIEALGVDEARRIIGERCRDCEGTGWQWFMPDGHKVECSTCDGSGAA